MKTEYSDLQYYAYMQVYTFKFWLVVFETMCLPFSMWLTSIKQLDEYMTYKIINI